MNLADLGKRKDVLVAASIVGIILLTVIVGNKLYQVQKKKMSYLKEDIKKEEAKNRGVEGIVILNKKSDFYEKRLSVQRDVSWLIRRITQLAKDAQIKIVFLQPQTPQRQEGYVRIPLEVKVEGSYHKLGGFLSNIESSSEFIRLDRLDLTTGYSGRQLTKKVKREKNARSSGRKTSLKEAEVQVENRDKRPTTSLVVSTIYLE